MNQSQSTRMGLSYDRLSQQSKRQNNEEQYKPKLTIKYNFSEPPKFAVNEKGNQNEKINSLMTYLSKQKEEYRDFKQKEKENIEKQKKIQQRKEEILFSGGVPKHTGEFKKHVRQNQNFGNQLFLPIVGKDGVLEDKTEFKSNNVKYLKDGQPWKHINKIPKCFHEDNINLYGDTQFQSYSSLSSQIQNPPSRLTSAQNDRNQYYTIDAIKIQDPSITHQQSNLKSLRKTSTASSHTHPARGMTANTLSSKYQSVHFSDKSRNLSSQRTIGTADQSKRGNIPGWKCFNHISQIFETNPHDNYYIKLDKPEKKIQRAFHPTKTKNDYFSQLQGTLSKHVIVEPKEVNIRAKDFDNLRCNDFDYHN